MTMQRAWPRIPLCVENAVVYDRNLNPADHMVTEHPAKEKGKRNQFRERFWEQLQYIGSGKAV